MPVRPDVDRTLPGLRRGDGLGARTGSRPDRLGPRRRFPRILATPSPVAASVGRDPASRGAFSSNVRACNFHRWAAREAASFNQTLDRARATPAAPRSTLRLRTIFYGLPTRRSAKR
jgi:hypothetical protein